MPYSRPSRLEAHTKEGDWVLDPCAGSGVCGVVCKRMNRNYVLIEKDQERYTKIVARLEGGQK